MRGGGLSHVSDSTRYLPDTVEGRFKNTAGMRYAVNVTSHIQIFGLLRPANACFFMEEKKARSNLRKVNRSSNQHYLNAPIGFVANPTNRWLRVIDSVGFNESLHSSTVHVIADSARIPP